MRRFDYSWVIYCSILILLCSFTKYEIKTSEELICKAHNIAKNELGTVEIGNNSGEEIAKYLASVDLKEGFNYCAAGIFWAFDSASKKLNIANPLPKTGVANQLFNYAKNNGERSEYLSQKYDLIVWRKYNSWQGHIEWIAEVQKAGWVKTIAFNSSKNGKQGVFYQRRNIYHPLGRLKIRGLIGFEGEK